MNTVKLTGVIILSLIGGLVFSQEDTLSFTLRDIQEYALNHNKQLLNAREDIVLTDAQYKETRAQGYPQVNGGMDYMTNFNYEVEFDFGGGGPSIPDIDPGLLDEGDREILEALGEMMAPAGPSTITMEDQLNAQVRVSQLLFSGQFWVGLEVAKISKTLSEKQLEKTGKDVKQQVTNTYYLILASEESLEILERNLSNLNNTLKHTQNMYNTGLVEKSDVDQIRMNVSQLQNTLESTKRSVLLSYNMLKIQLGLERNRVIRLQDDLYSVMKQTEKELLQEELNLNDNLSYQLMDYQELMKEQMVDLEKWSYAPTLSGFYSYTEKIMTTDFDLSPRNAAGLTLSVPIYSGGLRRAKVDIAKIELDKTRRNKSLLGDELKLQENQLKFELRSALDNYQTQKENVQVAQNVYGSYFNKYKQGMLSSLDLTQANSNYLQAENNYISSMLKLLQARLALEKLYNTL
ncbi:MAG: TolC family protein [Bacteroidota bacterium]